MTSVDPRIMQDLISAVDTRVEQLLRALPRTVYGVVSAIDRPTLTCSVKLSGDTAASAGFRYQRFAEPQVNDRVRVAIDPRGDRYVEAVYADYGAGNEAQQLYYGFPRVERETGSDRVIIDGRYEGDSQGRVRLEVFNNGDAGLQASDGTNFYDTTLKRIAAGHWEATSILEATDLIKGARGVFVEGTDVRDGNSAGTNYPIGLSWMFIADSGAAGWPDADGRGIVVTVSNGSTLISQLWFDRGSVAPGTRCATRNWNNGGSAWRAWQTLA